MGFILLLVFCSCFVLLIAIWFKFSFEGSYLGYLFLFCGLAKANLGVCNICMQYGIGNVNMQYALLVVWPA